MSSAVLDRSKSGQAGREATAFWLKVKDLAREAQKLPAESLVPKRKSSVVKDLRTLKAALRDIEQAMASSDAPAAAARAVSPAAPGDVVAAMVAKGELLDPAAFADKMNWTRQALSKALGANRVFFIEYKGARYYPSFYGDQRRYDRHKLEAITKVLGDLPGGAKLQFFMNPRGSLSKQTPLQALTRGRFAEVLAAAEGFAQS